ncbi:hypothetical protein DFH27DRAFT_557043 [Peziza echinospora]|nr:hypothetical protein DFH27DRAFT_557043 [Peziza echinospora]
MATPIAHGGCSGHENSGASLERKRKHAAVDGSDDDDQGEDEDQDQGDETSRQAIPPAAIPNGTSLDIVGGQATARKRAKNTTTAGGSTAAEVVEVVLYSDDSDYYDDDDGEGGGADGVPPSDDNPAASDSGNGHPPPPPPPPPHHTTAAGSAGAFNSPARSRRVVSGSDAPSLNSLTHAQHNQLLRLLLPSNLWPPCDTAPPPWERALERTRRCSWNREMAEVCRQLEEGGGYNDDDGDEGWEGEEEEFEEDDEEGMDWDGWV